MKMTKTKITGIELKNMNCFDKRENLNKATKFMSSNIARGLGNKFSANLTSNIFGNENIIMKKHEDISVALKRE